MSGNHEPASPAHLHADDALVPTLDDLTGTECEDEWLVAVPRGVELLTARHADAHVMDDGVSPRSGLFARADDDLFNDEIVGRGSEVGIDQRLFGPGRNASDGARGRR